MELIPKTTTYLKNKYGLVYESASRKEANIYADLLNKIFGDYGGDKKIRLKLQNMKHLILLDHIIINNNETHCIYVRQPWDKAVQSLVKTKV